MNAFKGTPGPWHVVIEEGDEWWFGSGNNKQAVVRNSTGASISVEGGNSEEELANARLIAAAPALLEALQAFMEYYRPPQIHPNLYDSQQERAWKLGDAAIAAALGEA